MKKEYYSISDIATMTSLSTRTIRTYIKNGLLNGNKKGGEWVFKEDDIEKFFNEPFVTQSIKIKRNSIVRDFIDADKKDINSVCSIFDYVVNSLEEAELLYNKIIEEVNSNKNGKIDFSFDYNHKINIVRIIISGEAELALKIIQKCFI